MSESAAGEYVTERWVCLGRRLSDRTKLVCEWQRPDGTTVTYAKVTGRPGRLYDVQVRTEPGHLWVQGTPEFAGALPDGDERRIGWEADERVALIRLEHYRLQRNDERVSQLADVVLPIRDLYRRQVGPDRKAALLAAFIELVTR